MDRNRCRDVGYAALERLDHEQALTHQLDRLAPSRHAQWPKDDERSSRQVGRPPHPGGAEGPQHRAGGP
jgi:hypothetical protein